MNDSNPVAGVEGSSRTPQQQHIADCRQSFKAAAILGHAFPIPKLSTPSAAKEFHAVFPDP